MLNKYLPFFIAIIFIAMGCNSSFPVTFYGVTFEDYIKGKRSQDSGYVSEVHPIHDQWKLKAFDDYRNNHMNGYVLSDLNLTLNLTNEAYVPEYWEFSYPFYCNGKGVINGFTASYEFDNAGNIRFSNLSSTHLESIPKKQDIEEWYFDALNTAKYYSVGYSRAYNRGSSVKRTLEISYKYGVLIFTLVPTPTKLPEVPSRMHQYSSSTNAHDVY